MLTLNINLWQYLHAKREIQFIDHELRRYRAPSPFPKHPSHSSTIDTRIKLDVLTLLKAKRKVQLFLYLESEQMLFKTLALSAKSRTM